MEIGKFNLIKTEGRARRGEFCTAHGVVQTPVFQNVGTAGAIKVAAFCITLRFLLSVITCDFLLWNANFYGGTDHEQRYS